MIFTDSDQIPKGKQQKVGTWEGGGHHTCVYIYIYVDMGVWQIEGLSPLSTPPNWSLEYENLQNLKIQRSITHVRKEVDLHSPNHVLEFYLFLSILIIVVSILLYIIPMLPLYAPILPNYVGTLKIRAPSFSALAAAGGQKKSATATTRNTRP